MVYVWVTYKFLLHVPTRTKSENPKETATKVDHKYTFHSTLDGKHDIYKVNGNSKK